MRHTEYLVINEEERKATIAAIDLYAHLCGFSQPETVNEVQRAMMATGHDDNPDHIWYLVLTKTERVETIRALEGLQAYTGYTQSPVIENVILALKNPKEIPDFTKPAAEIPEGWKP